MFEQTDFPLTLWPSALFVCCEKSLSVLFCDTIPYLPGLQITSRVKGCTLAAIHTGHTQNGASLMCRHTHYKYLNNKPTHTHCELIKKHIHSLQERNCKKFAATLWLFPELCSADLVGACTCALICQHSPLSQSGFPLCTLCNKLSEQNFLFCSVFSVNCENKLVLYPH